MTQDYAVLCPSYRRVTSAISHKLFPPEKFWYVVREFEAPAYRKVWPQVIAIPDGAVSNIADTRNWIWSYAEQLGIRWLVQCDDDIKRFLWLLHRKRHYLDVSALDQIVLNGFQMAEDAGTCLWGMNIVPDPMSYYPNTPFAFDKPVLGPFLGTVDMKLRSDERLTLKEDYDLFLQAMSHSGKVLRFNYLYYDCDHQELAGGCQTYRTSEKEAEQNLLLQQKWGSEIVQRNRRYPDSVNMKIQIPRA